MKALMLALALAVCGLAQVTYTTTCPSQAKAGTQVTCNTVTVGGTPVATEGTVSVTSPAGPVTWSINTAVVGKQIASAASTGIFVLYGMNATPISNGTMASISFTMPGGNVNVGVGTLFASDGVGISLPVTTNPPVAISVLSNCDINGDGQLTTADVAAELTLILAGGQNAPNVSSLQKVVNAVLGGACTL